jgi:hypothetical protein
VLHSFHLFSFHHYSRVLFSFEPDEAELAAQDAAAKAATVNEQDVLDHYNSSMRSQQAGGGGGGGGGAVQFQQAGGEGQQFAANGEAVEYETAYLPTKGRPMRANRKVSKRQAAAYSLVGNRRADTRKEPAALRPRPQRYPVWEFAASNQ